MQIDPGSQASEEGCWLSLITTLQRHGGGRGSLGTTQGSIRTSSLEPAEASQAFPSSLWAPSLYSAASSAHGKGSPVK